MTDSDKKVKEKVNPESDKYKVVLKFVNRILVNLKKDEVDDLTKFANIDREDIIKEENKKVLIEMEKDLFQHFNKDKCGFYRKTANGWVLNVLRGMVKDMGYEFKPVKKDVCEYRDGKSCKRTHYFYTIQ